MATSSTISTATTASASIASASFAAYLKERHHGQQELRKRQFEHRLILATHKFDEIGRLARARRNRRRCEAAEMLRLSQISNKQVFDEVFVDYGRSLKPDLIVAQWNHLGRLQPDQRRRALPAAGRAVGQGRGLPLVQHGRRGGRTDLAEGILGEGTLQARYIRGTFDDKPFTLGKYESTRTRVAIAELAANGGAPMGFYTRFTDPEARQEIVRYYQFLKRYDAIYRANRPHAEMVLLFPRLKVAEGGMVAVDAVEHFRITGKRFLDRHMLFEILSDEPLHEARRARHRTVFEPGFYANTYQEISRTAGG